MDVKKAIETRRAYRSLDPVPISKELIRDLAESAGLAPSCFNNQPWRFVFVKDPEMLSKIHGALSRGNRWIKRASLIIAVYSKSEDDCNIQGRSYHHFDVGMATAFMILRATELGLVAHPIAGFNEVKVKTILGISEEMQVITLVNVGRKSENLNELLSEDQRQLEVERPERYNFERYAYIDKVSEN